MFLRSDCNDWLEGPNRRVRVLFGGPPGAEPLNGNGDEEEGRVNDVDYGRHFPSLAKLTVWPVDCEYGSERKLRKSGARLGWEAFLPFLSAFLPSLGPPFPIAVKALDIPFLLQGKYHPVLDNLEAIFPAVAFPPEALAAARRCPHWTEENDVQEDLHGWMSSFH